MGRDFITINQDSQDLFKKFENDAHESNIFYDDLNDDESTSKSNTDTASGNSGTGSGSGIGSLIASCTNYGKDVEEKLRKKRIKKKKKYKLSNNTMLDEGIDLNSFELASSVGDTSNVFTSAAFTTSHRYSSISNQMKTSNNNNLMNDSNKVITFKRTSQINGNNNLYGSTVEEETQFDKNYSITNETKSKKQNSNIKNIKNLFFKRGPKRLESQLSTATTATYLSSVYSSSGSKSPNNIDILNNLEQEQQNFNNLLLAPLLKPSRSNSNSSTSTFSGNLNNSYDSNKFNHINNIHKNANSGKIFVKHFDLVKFFFK